jgi:8-amino-7-oxononanoate synthase
MFFADFIVLQMSELTGYLVHIIMNENFLDKKLLGRLEEQALRTLRPRTEETDYFSNDYLGITRQGLIETALSDGQYAHGSTGSRLLSGNYALIEETEKEIAAFHDADSALIFNSGYDANFGLLACIARKGDIFLYDKLVHASIRDGIRQSLAESHSFLHNDPGALEKKLITHAAGGKNCFVVTESVFSMDGDRAPLDKMAALCEKYEAHFIVDEAHATGVIGARGEGCIQLLGLQKKCLARIHTFGKALGCHGAVILGSRTLRSYLINFCRPLIYSTALPPVAVAAIRASYKIFPGMLRQREDIEKLIRLFDHSGFQKSDTAIQCFILAGNDSVKKLSRELQLHHLDARPILYPTVPKGQERLRITLHSFNTPQETIRLISLLGPYRTG